MLMIRAFFLLAKMSVEKKIKKTFTIINLHSIHHLESRNIIIWVS